LAAKGNIIAIIAISFATVGALWAAGNLMNRPPEAEVPVEGITLLAERSTFNGTNPDIYVQVNVPVKLVVVNKDVITHNLVIEDRTGGILNVDTAPLKAEQHFNAAILAYKLGTYEYSCTYHPEMRGRIIAG
jgi:plastocyanin